MRRSERQCHILARWQIAWTKQHCLNNRTSCLDAGRPHVPVPLAATRLNTSIWRMPRLQAPDGRDALALLEPMSTATMLWPIPLILHLPPVGPVDHYRDNYRFPNRGHAFGSSRPCTDLVAAGTGKVTKMTIRGAQKDWRECHPPVR